MRRRIRRSLGVVGLLAILALIWWARPTQDSDLRKKTIKSSARVQIDARAKPKPSTTNAPKEATPEWQADVFARIAASEYAPQFEGDRVRAVNRAQKLDLTWERDGLHFRPGGAESASHIIAARSLSRGENSTTLDPVGFRVGDCGSNKTKNVDGDCLRRVERDLGPISEWWDNRPDGIEQGFEIHERPHSSSNGPLRIALETPGLGIEIRSDRRSAALTNKGEGKQLLASNFDYAGLTAWDAHRKPMDAHFETTEHGLAIVLDDAEAQYPIYVDPILTTAPWTFESNLPFEGFGAQAGYEVAAAGDLNADGFGDILVAAPEYSNPSVPTHARVWAFYGTSSGPETTPSWTISTAIAPYIGTEDLGMSLSTAGDVNNDGFSDIIIASSTYTRVYLGSSSRTTPLINFTYTPSQGTATISSAAGVGDLNDDGFSDIAIGVPGFDTTGTGHDNGAVFVFMGSSSGINSGSLVQLSMNVIGESFGMKVAAAYDVNADGFSDLLATSANTDRTFLFLGSALGVATSPVLTLVAASSNPWGCSIAGLGDVNGDGFADFAVGEAYHDSPNTDSGQIQIFFGDSSPGSLSIQPLTLSMGANANVGQKVAGIGDINGDGFNDLATSSYWRDHGSSLQEGLVQVLYGSLSGIDEDHIWSMWGGTSFMFFGHGIAAAGDTNGDGFADLLVGAPRYTNGQSWEGRAYVYFGGGGILGTPTHLKAGAYWERLGYSLAGAGDVNGDGFDDVIAGAPNSGKAYLYVGSAAGIATMPSCSCTSCGGWSVAGIGDVNGDGLADYAVGDPLYDGTYTDQGAVYVFHGTANLSAACTAATTLTLAAGTSGENFGRSIDGAFDVNGNGFSELLVGAPGIGKVLLYDGSSTGLSTPTWSYVGSGNVGYSVGGGGDINNDGYPDFVVGVPNYSGGRALLFKGSSSGPSSTPNWSYTSTQSGSQFGASVALIGDVNGDARSDIAIGAPHYDADAGRVFVFHGTSTVPGSAADWTHAGGTAANFGWSVARAGDVNGDGFADLLAGAPQFDGAGAYYLPSTAGQALLFLGGTSGLSATAAWTYPGNFFGTGSTLAGFGDVNGDSFADVGIGSWGVVDAEFWMTTGNFVTAYGNGENNSSPAFSMIPRTIRAGTVVNIAPWARSDYTTSYRVRIKTRSPWGRSDVAVAVENKPRGTAFNLGALTTGTFSEVASVLGLIRYVSVGSLTAGTSYHWRARVKYKPKHAFPVLWSPWQWGGLSGDAQSTHLKTAP